MAFANQRAFDLPGAREAAMGLDWRDDFRRRDAGNTTGAYGRNGGISNPVRTELTAGSTILRFGESGVVNIAAAGSWWIGWSDYVRIERQAGGSSTILTDILRQTCCVALGWNAMDMVLQAELKLPLLAYSGRGRIAEAGGIVMRPLALLDGAEVTQLYIPGMGSSDLRHDALLLRFGHMASGKRYSLTHRQRPAHWPAEAAPQPPPWPAG